MRGVFKVLGKRGAIDVLGNLARGKRRFSGILPVVGNQKTLVRRLKELSSHGLINERSGYYMVTDKGLMLLRAIENLKLVFGEDGRWLKEAMEIVTVWAKG